MKNKRKTFLTHFSLSFSSFKKLSLRFEISRNQIAQKMKLAVVVSHEQAFEFTQKDQQQQRQLGYDAEHIKRNLAVDATQMANAVKLFCHN